MSRAIIYIFFGMLLSSCYSGNKPPSDVIGPEEMKSIMWDMTMAQQMASELARKDSLVSVALETKALTKRIFEIHQIDSAHFNASYNWYLRHPVVFKLIFDSLYAQKQRETMYREEKKAEGPKDYLIDPFKRRLIK